MNDERNYDDIDDVLPIEPARAAQALVYIIAGLMAVALVWASVAKLDRVTRGEGRVVPSNKLQEVQSLEGGIVKEILVRSGDRVAAGDVLVRLDQTQLNADYVQERDGYNLIAARLMRLEAEAAGTRLKFPEELEGAAPGIVADERSLYEARAADLATALELKRSELGQAEAAKRAADSALSLAGEEMRIIEPLVKQGIEPRIELVRARQRYAQADGEAQRAAISLDRARSEIRGIEEAFRTSATDELTRTKSQMAQYAGELPAIRDKIDRTDLKAPIEGVVNRVLVATVGGVVRPGETIVEIVPANDSPLVRARIKPADIGFLEVGQQAMVKLTAYDSALYGGLPARIETIGADAIEDPKTGEPYFEILVRTDTMALETKVGELRIMPGMAAEVDILNGKRTVIAYLLKPLAEVQGKALRED